MSHLCGIIDEIAVQEGNSWSHPYNIVAIVVIEKKDADKCASLVGVRLLRK